MRTIDDQLEDRVNAATYDCTVAEDVKRVLCAVKPHLMVTDPPYGVDYDPNWRNEAARNGSLVHTIGATAVGKVQNDARVDVAVERWQAFTGDTARLEADGRTFAAVTAERREPPQRPPVGQRRAKQEWK